MLEIDVPGFHKLTLEHLVMDYNGTLALDGNLLEGVQSRLKRLGEILSLHVITADTFGQVRSNLSSLACEIVILPADGQVRAKAAFVEKLGHARVIAIGNGRNDREMLAAASLGIAVMQGEGAAYATMASADLVAPDITAALDLLLFPKRLVATLRS